MYIAHKEFIALNQSLQSAYQYSIASAARGSWVPYVASSTKGLGVADVRQFLVESVKLRVGQGAEYFDLDTESVAVEHKQLAGGFEIQSRDLISGAMREVLLSAARGLGESVELTKQALLLALINNPNAKAYDGLAFFNSGHFNNYKDTSQGVYANAETGKDLTADNLAAAIAQIENRVMADGTPRNLKAKWLLHGPSLKKAASAATGAQYYSGAFNIIEKTKSTYGVLPLTVPGLAQVDGKDVWIVTAEHSVGGDALSRPFGVSTLIEPHITDFTGITVPHLERMQQLEYILAGDLAVFLGHPYLAHRCAVS